MAPGCLLIYHRRFWPVAAVGRFIHKAGTAKMQGDIVSQGVELMLYGMGTVVLFLALLVVATTLMSRGITRYFPEPEPPVRAALEKLHGQRQSPVDDPNLVTAISAAIHQNRAKR